MTALRLVAMAAFLAAGSAPSGAQESPRKAEDRLVPTQDWIQRDGDKRKVATTIEIVLLVTVLTLAPSLLVLATSFTRIVIVLSFLRRALSTQDLPPNQVLIGLSLALTFLVMSPTLSAIKQDALDPYFAEKNAISQREMIDRSVGHLRAFMARHVRPQDVSLFAEATKSREETAITSPDDAPTEVLLPAFVIGELRRAFIMGFALFLPFLVIDLLVASLLLSTGMFMLPPMLVSLPFKILLFVLVDGWALVVSSLLRSFS